MLPDIFRDESRHRLLTPESIIPSQSSFLFNNLGSIQCAFIPLNPVFTPFIAFGM
ncbi:MAG: hypothetical protein QOD84_2835 [Acidobacteriaceae bacterium]|jgi:hypothetical protein